MDRFFAGFLIALGAAALLLIAAIAGAFFGMVGGWVVGLFFTETITTVLAAFGVAPVAVWKLGAFFGFIGGFFKSIQTNNK